jgi:hypothetical protein
MTQSIPRDHTYYQELPKEGESFLNFDNLLEFTRDTSVKDKFNFWTPRSIPILVPATPKPNGVQHYTRTGFKGSSHGT